MAPAKSNKRTSKAAGPAAKKAKPDLNLVGVLHAIRQADLPAECRAMLEAGVPACLTTPANERHELQVKMVSWVERVFDDLQTKLGDAVATADAEVASATTKKAELESKVTEAKEVASAKAEVAKAKDSELAATRQAVKEAKTKASAAVAAQKSGDSELRTATDAKEKLEAALTEHVGFLKTNEGFDAKQATSHTKKLTPIVKQLMLDESLLTALPSAATQAPSKRREFDRMVIDQLEAGIQGRVDELTATLKEGEAGMAERAGVVAAAQKEVEEAQEAQGTASSALAAARDDETAASTALNDAHAALDAGTSELATATTAKEEKAFAFDNFKNYNVECFKLLRDAGVEKEEATAA
mmetsp:Transcript_100502/g.299878  ORF Transcript_100502/g.299878 Transcript_100502/m.299878 type:complete len:356 (-) Transcript_100502:212-1279(-)|eukprot:CAMPEP_0175225638 /NCGR_PEP_ID=MMETSP0093-20121207/22484_1 /TAXON_ID=311494 /ORGANISM="Alexandrium monilatum, Strain CCMP3105" /LENGTH=355 /DNA_ID=CAMNT_0016519345 /DNA_START=55 /DNA_END=1122 /DNA_ORIENTATION=+